MTGLREGSRSSFVCRILSKYMRLGNVSGFVLLALLCLLLAVRWMSAAAWSNTQPSRASEALGAVLAAAGLLVPVLVHGGVRSREVARSEGRRAERWPVAVVMAGALLFAGLNAGVAAGDASPKGTDLLIALALTPVVVAVVLVVRGAAGDGLTGGDLLPGLLAPAGLLLILPQPAFGSAAATLILLGAPVSAGLGAAWLMPHRSGMFPVRSMGFALGGAAFFFGTLSLLPPHPQLSTAILPAVMLDAACFVLAVGSLAGLGAMRFSALFAAVPSLLLLEGLVLERVRPTWEQAGGLVLLLIATVLLLRASAETDQRRGVSLLN